MKVRKIGDVINDFELLGTETKFTSGGNKYTCYIVKCIKCGKQCSKPIRNFMRGDKCECSSNYHKHGKSDTRLYNIYMGMISRTKNAKDQAYKWYGAKGVEICKEWQKDFDVFYEWAVKNGYAENLTIDRINPLGNYEPSNCRWVTIEEQQKNRNLAYNVHLVTYKGETLPMKHMANKYDINYNTFQRRLRKGWTVERCIEEPIHEECRRIKAL